MLPQMTSIQPAGSKRYTVPPTLQKADASGLLADTCQMDGICSYRACFILAA